MKSIQFFGAVGMVTGSCTLLTGDDGSQILVDLGMFQGNEDLEKLNFGKLEFDVLKLAGVVLTHAHLDHSGRLPLLIKAGYKGKIYMTRATRMLAALVLEDSAKIAAENGNRHAGEMEQTHPSPIQRTGLTPSPEREGILYSEEDVEGVLSQIETYEYGHIFAVGEFEVVFRDAGHILGSSSIEISDKSGKKIVFSGDLGNTPEDMIKPTQVPERADYAVIETTYGGRTHVNEDPNEVLREEINKVEETKGVLLIPSFSIERAQELLHRINHLKNEKKIALDTKVFLDSPMAIRVTEIFRRSPELYNRELSEELKVDDPFDFSGLVLCEESKESKMIVLNPAPKVIIAGSGMMHGGRILHHALNYLPDSKTRLLFVGFQAPGTIGYMLCNGLTRVRIHDQEVQVAAKIRMVESMSCHADQGKLLSWLKSVKGLKRVFLNHGEDDERKLFAGKVRDELKLEVICPEMGEERGL